MRYSLRSLMILVTLVSVTLGTAMGRINYLHGQAELHEEKYAEAVERLAVLTRHRHFGIGKVVDFVTSRFSDNQGEKGFVFIVGGNNDLGDVSKSDFIPLWNEACQQHRLAEAYRQRVSRPWAPVRLPDVKSEE